MLPSSRNPAEPLLATELTQRKGGVIQPYRAGFQGIGVASAAKVRSWIIITLSSDALSINAASRVNELGNTNPQLHSCE